MLSYNLPFFVLLFYPKSSRLYHRNRHFSTPYAKKMYKTNLKYFFWIFLIFLNFSIDIIPFLSYYKWAVDERSKQSEASRLKKCRNGGIGRRAGFRCLWSQDRVGSSPISCIIFSLCVSRIGPVDQFGLPWWEVWKLPGRVFLFLCGEDVQTGKEKQTNLRQCKIV